MTTEITTALADETWPPIPPDVRVQLAGYLHEGLVAAKGIVGIPIRKMVDEAVEAYINGLLRRMVYDKLEEKAQAKAV